MSDPVRLKGVAASMGVAVGTARVLAWGRRRISFRRITQGQVASEIDRFRAAVAASHAEIEVARQELAQQHGATYASILDAYLLMHGDALLIDATCDTIREENINAEWAVSRVAERLKAPLLRDGSSYFRERARDVDHVKEHLLRELCGEDRTELPGQGPVVLIAHDLTPADAVQMLAPPTVGLVTEVGGGSSHTAILARTFGVPAVVGVGSVPIEIEDDQDVVVDGFGGQVIIGASRRERSQAEARRDRFLAFLDAERDRSAVTLDGTSISVAANMELPSELEAALASGADGIGLYRTEFMCLNRPEPPSEDEQLDIYRTIAAALAPSKVIFRTFDWRRDKRPAGFDMGEDQAGWLRTQIKAVLRASEWGHVALMFPMVATVRELLDAKILVEQCRSELGERGAPCASLQVGMMVEVPSAALMAEGFARHADFFAVGTNDLAHYTLAVDRHGNQASAGANPLDPAVLRLLERTVRAAGDAGIPCSMCGDMAAHPLALSLALGLGYREISVPIRLLPLARAVVRSVDIELAGPLAHDALSCESAEDVRLLVTDRMGEGFDPAWIRQEAV
ncbi:MAG: hypothetical protein AMJ62_14425 [Myxococcales bacterium SG8_38]|nr:MAG: hypothetical protein AMJ62_14425 [Myxococcales bacterium SG8_38]